MHTLRKRSRTFKLAVLPRVQKSYLPRVWRKAENRPTPKQEQPRKIPSYVFDCVLFCSITSKTYKMDHKKTIDNLIDSLTMNASDFVFNTKVISSENARHIAIGAYAAGSKQTKVAQTSHGKGLDPIAKAYEAGREDAKKKALEIADNIDNPADRALMKDMLEDLL